jgi:hypothetical protein
MTIFPPHATKRGGKIGTIGVCNIITEGQAAFRLARAPKDLDWYGDRRSKGWQTKEQGQPPQTVAGQDQKLHVVKQYRRYDPNP